MCAAIAGRSTGAVVPERLESSVQIFMRGFEPGLT